VEDVESLKKGFGCLKVSDFQNFRVEVKVFKIN